MSTEHPSRGAHEVSSTAQEFFGRESRILNDLAGGSGFRFTRGENWSIIPETGEATYDPKFFEERGYTPAQAVFGAMHEIKCHFVETADLLSTKDGVTELTALKRRSRSKKYLHTWDNIRTDLKGNRAIIGFAPSLRGDIQNLYRDTLFPETDFRKHPKHVQFMYAVIREGMLPSETTAIDPDVREALAALRNQNGTDVLALATSPEVDAVRALQLSKLFIEPVLDRLYVQDLEKRQEQSKDSQEGDQQGDGDFSESYEDFEKNHHDPISKKEIEKKIRERNKQTSDSEKQDNAYEAEHGVSADEVRAYRKEYQKVEPLIEPLRDLFNRIIDERIVTKRHLAGLHEEGIMIHPGLVAQTYLNVKAGDPNPKTMIDFETESEIETLTTDINIRFVGDQSGSMEGEKAIMQRRAAIAVMEGLQEFTEMLDEDRDKLGVDLEVQTELRAFGTDTATKTATYKPLSKELEEHDRITYFKQLAHTSGVTNNFDVLEEIHDDILERSREDPSYGDKLREGRLREIVFIFSDGESDDKAHTQEIAAKLRKLGVTLIPIGMGENATAIVETYAPDGIVCPDVTQLPQITEKALGDILKTI